MAITLGDDALFMGPNSTKYHSGCPITPAKIRCTERKASPFERLSNPSFKRGHWKRNNQDPKSEGANFAESQAKPHKEINPNSYRKKLCQNYIDLIRFLPWIRHLRFCLRLLLSLFMPYRSAMLLLACTPPMRGGVRWGREIRGSTGC